MPSRLRLAFLIFALVLLPLRGWLGAGMPMGEAAAAAHPAQAMAQITVHAAMHEASATPPCHEPIAPAGDAAHGTASGHAAAQEGAGDAPSSGLSHGSCQLCQLCHSGMMVPRIAALPALELPRVAPAAPLAQFASAEPVPLHRPPIS